MIWRLSGPLRWIGGLAEPCWADLPTKRAAEQRDAARVVVEGRTDLDVVLAARASSEEALDLCMVEAGQPGHRCRQPIAQLGGRLRVPRVARRVVRAAGVVVVPKDEARVSRRVRGAHAADDAALGVGDAQRQLRVEAGLARQRHRLPMRRADLCATGLHIGWLARLPEAGWSDPVLDLAHYQGALRGIILAGSVLHARAYVVLHAHVAARGELLPDLGVDAVGADEQVIGDAPRSAATEAHVDGAAAKVDLATLGAERRTHAAAVLGLQAPQHHRRELLPGETQQSGLNPKRGLPGTRLSHVHIGAYPLDLVEQARYLVEGVASTDAETKAGGAVTWRAALRRQLKDLDNRTRVLAEQGIRKE